MKFKPKKKKKKNQGNQRLDKQLKFDACYINFSIYFLCSQDVSSAVWKEQNTFLY